ncbi:MAG TPA: hypothetical protein VLA39_00445 [Marinobacterium sp.]|nr:hypothetical protein [Marinobacterium sp.]
MLTDHPSHMQIELPFESLSMEQLILAYRQQLQAVKETAELIDELVEEHDADIEVLRQISARIQREKVKMADAELVETQ